MPLIPYTPPAGFYDSPFTWVYDASGLTDGLDYPNQFVYLLGGYGDFLMRRALDFSRILNTLTGTYRLRDRTGDYIQSQGVHVLAGGEVPFAPEVYYKELGAIRFDLVKYAQPANIYTAQLAFQGSRRLPGVSPRAARLAVIGPVKPKTYTYQAIAELTALAPTGPVTVNTKVNDYDFELYQLMVFKVTTATGLFGVDGPSMRITANDPGPSDITAVAVVNGPNEPLVVTLIGHEINVQLASNGSSDPTSTALEVYNAILANASIMQLVTLSDLVSGASVFSPTTTALTGGAYIPISTPICAITLFDKDRVACSNAPVLDIYYNGAPTRSRSRSGDGALYYHGGAIVPPLYYQKDNQIRVDVTSLAIDAADIPFSVAVLLIGKQLMPCGGQQ
jgi:hypothetical protein